MSFEWQPLSRKAYTSIVQSDGRLNIWEGAVRSSKTISTILRWIEFVQDAPQGVLFMVGKTTRTLKRNIIDIIIDMVGRQNARYNSGTNIFYLFDREIECVGANDERSSEKIRGATVAGCYGDEITLWPESFFTMMLSRLSVRGAKFFGTTNPDNPYHWLKVNYLDRREELDIKVFHFNLDDNPSLDPDYVNALKREYVGLWYQRFILGLWVMADGSVYDMWDEAKHVVDVKVLLQQKERVRHGRHFVSIDYGTNNPCTFGLYGYDGPGHTVYLVKEYYYDSNRLSRQKTDSEYADDYVSFIGDIRPVAVYVDPSAASFIAELRKRGVAVSEAKNDVLNGIRFVGNMRTSGQYKVDKGCKDTIREYSGYVWDAHAQKRGEDAPLKQNDHAMDRDRYALYSHFYRSGAKVIGFNYK